MSLRKDPLDPRFHATSFSSGRSTVGDDELYPVTGHGPITDDASNEHSYFDKNTTAMRNTALATMDRASDFAG
jgi:hypothetical protein